MTKKAWEGRFAEETDKLVEKFTSSIDFDKYLYFYDIEGSKAHCRMLAKKAIISNDEADLIIKGLDRIKKDIEENNFEYQDSLEDIHMHIEAKLFEYIGDAAHKLHTARSRNDQIALDIRMYLRGKTNNIINKLSLFRKTLVNFAKTHTNAVMPGYTHTKRAQPVLFSHHIMAYYEMFSRDSARFKDALKRINVMPLGAAALAGTTYPIDREYTANLLNFLEISRNSMDAVSDRDFILEFLSCASICMVHFSRISEELILWSSNEFDFIEISDGFTTGSSIMPQKKNPDVAELVRGKTGRVFGSLFAVFTMMKSLPLAYNRDMQEDKEPLFDAVDTLAFCLEVYIKMFPNIQIKEDVMKKAAMSGFLNATELADYLAAKKMPFRQAHSCAGKAVKYAIEQNKELHELSLTELKAFSEIFEDDVFEFLILENAINRRTSAGGTALSSVLKEIAFAEEKLKEELTC
jgi:argininosuccinate lyase